MNRSQVASLLLAASAAISLNASAGVITSPTAVVGLVGGEAAPGDVQHIIDRSGLTPTFTSGVTDFDTYIAGDPRHTYLYSGYEWFSAANTNSASITLDMGSTVNLLRLAFWNDEFAGTSRLTVFACDTAACGVAINLGQFSPINNAANVPDYGAEVFDIADALTRYVRLDVVGPQADALWTGPAIGEVAFDVGAVPEPGTLALLGLGLAGLAATRRRKQ